MCKVNKWQIPFSPSLIFEVKSTRSELAFIRVLRLGLGKCEGCFHFRHRRTSSEDFGLLRKTSDFFGNIRKWSCHFQKSQHSQDKNLMPIFQRKLAGRQPCSFMPYWLTDWLFDWLTDRPTDRLTDWLIKWLIDWLIDRLIFFILSVCLKD